MSGVAVTVLVFLVGVAVAVTVVTCRRKSEAIDRGIESSCGNVGVGRGCSFVRGATLCIEGKMERRTNGCDGKDSSPSEDGRRGAILSDTANRLDSSVWFAQSSLYVSRLRAAADVVMDYWMPRNCATGVR